MADENRDGHPVRSLLPELKREIGEAIRNLRNEHNLTQAEFGFRIGVEGSTVSSWEHGKAAPTRTSRLVIIKDEFGLDINAMIKDWEKRYPGGTRINQPPPTGTDNKDDQEGFKLRKE